MIDDNSRAFAETVFRREPTREKEIKDALKIEAERHEAAVKNMQPATSVAPAMGRPIESQVIESK